MAREQPGSNGVDLAEAEAFLRLYYAESSGSGLFDARLREVRKQVGNDGTYEHTPGELTFGARVAWRNSSRCIGRLYWQSLRVRDRRHITTAAGIAAEAVSHLREATNSGRIRPTITVFAPARPDQPRGSLTEDGPRIWNEQLIRYAGYRQPDGAVVGDPRYAQFTALARNLGWPGGDGTRFDPLPLIVQLPGRPPAWFPVPADAVLEVPISHPRYDWFAELGLRWHAVPAISNMTLEIGGLRYPCAPFNGWYMGTEIGARNLADSYRYDMLPAIARGLGLDTSDERSLWRDRAVVELNVAVLDSYAKAGVTIADHHTESRHFLSHLRRENKHGRPTPAEWSWIVPPISGATTPVFHRIFHDADLRPNYVHDPIAIELGLGRAPQAAVRSAY